MAVGAGISYFVAYAYCLCAWSNALGRLIKYIREFVLGKLIMHEACMAQLYIIEEKYSGYCLGATKVKFIRD